MSKNPFVCKDCNVDTSDIGEYYMVHDEVWYSVAIFKEMLCIGCLENRLGRKLVSSDFTNAPINLGYFEQSERLLDRLISK